MSVVRDESLVEATEAKEAANVRRFLECGPLPDGIQFLRLGLYARSGHDVATELNSLLCKEAFLELPVKVSITQGLENLADMFRMLFQAFRVDDYVIEVDFREVSEMSQYLVHGPLESGGSIAHFEGITLNWNVRYFVWNVVLWTSSWWNLIWW